MPSPTTTAQQTIQAAQQLTANLASLQFPPPITHTYNPLTYAWNAHKQYLTRYANQPKHTLFLGINPGPFGMMQTGIPFGEINAVRNWLHIKTNIQPPQNQHPKRPIQGFQCPRSEISGRRLWSLFKSQFQTADNFFTQHFVANYCPLAFLQNTGKNITPDKLPKHTSQPLFQICNTHLQQLIQILQPKWIIAIGNFARQQAQSALPKKTNIQIGQILHPSPANPAANRNWSQQAQQQMHNLGLWQKPNPN